MVDQSYIPGSNAAYWIEGRGEGSGKGICRGIWRRARKALTCHHGPAPHPIAPGERYLDTRELIGPWATIKCCEKCANAAKHTY